MNCTEIKKGGKVTRQAILDKVAAGHPDFEVYRGHIVISLADGTIDILDLDASYLCTTNHHTRVKIVIDAMTGLNEAFRR